MMSMLLAILPAAIVAVLVFWLLRRFAPNFGMPKPKAA